MRTATRCCALDRIGRLLLHDRAAAVRARGAHQGLRADVVDMRRHDLHAGRAARRARRQGRRRAPALLAVALPWDPARRSSAGHQRLLSSPTTSARRAAAGDLAVRRPGGRRWYVPLVASALLAWAEVADSSRLSPDHPARAGVRGARGAGGPGARGHPDLARAKHDAAYELPWPRGLARRRGAVDPAGRHRSGRLSRSGRSAQLRRCSRSSGTTCRPPARACSCFSARTPAGPSAGGDGFLLPHLAGSRSPPPGSRWRVAVRGSRTWSPGVARRHRVNLARSS